MKCNRSKKKPNVILCEELEPRLLLSADLVGVAIDPIGNDTEHSANEANLQAIEAALQSENSADTDSTTQELVIIDPATADYESLLDDLLRENGNGRNFEIVLLDTGVDGIDQISNILDGYSGLDAIHLISHGSDGVVQLGDTNLDLDLLKQAEDQITTWGDALSLEGDWLIYGCDVASTTAGERFVEEFANLTGADVVASDDRTGQSASGGDWVLEYQAGSIETAIAFSNSLQNSWGGTLDIATGLIGHYAFDEGSGTTATDASISGNHGTLFDGPVYTTGQVGSHALSFNSNFDRVEVSDSAATDFGSGDFSIGFWFNSTYSGPQARLLGDTADGGGDGYVFYTNGSDDLNLEVSSGPNAIILTANGLFDGAWHHVTGVRSGADFTLYVDGHEADQWLDSPVGDINNSLPLLIGASNVFGDYDGLIDEVRLYDRALSADDAIELFTDGGGVVSYPTSYGMDNSQEWITNVSFAGIDNTTGREAGGYGDYTGQTATIERGTSSTLSVTISPQFNEYVNAWVDWNQDNDFNDPGEAYTLATNTSSPGPHTLSITAPVDAVTGTTVMRVSLQYAFAPSPGETMNYGEVEDYSVNVTGNVDPVITSNGGAASANVNVDENTTAVTTVTATDADLDTLTYSIDPASADAGRFTINSSTGVLTFITAPNFENPTDTNGDNVYEVTVEVDDGNGGVVVQAISVTVSNVNEAPIDIVTPDSLQLNMDGDEDDYASAANFTDFPSTALTYEISFAASPQGDTTLASYAVASQDNEFELYMDAGDLIIYFGGGSFWPTSISEGMLFDGERHQLSVSWESATGNTRVYVDGVLQDSRTSFRDGVTLQSGGTFVLGQEQDSLGGNFESYQRFEGNIYDVRIYGDVRTDQEIADNANTLLTNPSVDPNLVANWQMTDNGSGGIADLASAQDLTLFVHAGFGPLAVSELSPNGTHVGFVSTIDPDAGDTHTYSLIDDAGGAFAIETNTGQITVANTSLIDFEMAATMDVTVRATDAGGLTYDEVVSIVINDINDPPVITSDGGGDLANISIDENTTRVTTVNAIDDELDTLTYSIDPVSTDAGLFTINSSTGELTFIAAPDFEAPIDANGDNVYEVAVEAGDGNGGVDTQDIAVTVTNSNEGPTYFLAQTPNFTAHTIATNADGAYSVTSADLDGDGDLDVLSTSYTNDTIYWYQNDGSENFTAYAVTTTAEDSFDIVVADMDDDGDLDVVSAANFGGEVHWYENDGSQNFTAHIISTVSSAISVATADMDGDGDLDVVSASFSDDMVIWHENDGNENFTDHTITMTAENPWDVAIADVDGDGDLDVLSASETDNTIAWYENDGGQSFTTHTITTSASGARDVTTADMDGDGDLDVLSASRDDDTISWYENDGNENFTAHDITTTANGAYSVSAADMDGDGDLDVLSASQNDNTIAWYENDGSENFTAYDITTAATFATSVAVADVDSDSDIDVISVSQGGGTVTWYENPLCTLDGAPIFTEGGPAVVLDADVEVFDTELSTVDNFNAATLTLERSGGANAEDVYSATGTLGSISAISGNVMVGATNIGSYTNSGGTLVFTFNANATNALVNSAMQQIAYSNNSDIPSASAQINWTFDDGNTGAQGSGGALQTIGGTSVSIIAVNDPPVITSNGGGDTANIDVDENTTAVTTVTATDAELDTITYAIDPASPDADEFTINGSTGVLTFIATPDFETPADANADNVYEVTVVVDDGNGGVDTQALSVTVIAVSEVIPVTNADSITVAEGGTVTTLVGGSTNVLNNDTGLGDTPVTVSLVTDVTNGTLTLNGDGTFSYTHDGSENFPDSFTYRVTDNDGETADATVNINVTPVSDATPVANADSISVVEGGTVTTLDGGFSTVLNNDTGLGDTPVTVSLVTNVTNGTLTLNGDGTFSYTHDGSENFTDSFTYRVTDNDGETADATVNINITPVSDATPVANADSISVDEGATVTTLDGGFTSVLNNDTGLGDTPVTVSLVTDVTNGTLILNGDGTFSYTHDGSENFSDSFTYRVTDNDGETADATVMINVTPVSDATPVANADNITVAEGGTATTLVGGSGTVLNNDTGLGDTPVTVSLVTDVTNGTLTLNGDGTFSYTHDGSENFTDSFTYRVTDNDGETADATVAINVNPVSDATPIANADSISVAEGATVTTLDGGFTSVLNNDMGVGDTPVTVSLVTDVTNGSLTLNGDGTFSYTHDGSENFTDSFTYRVTDNDGETADATVAINVSPVSDATPIANADSISAAEGATVTTLDGGFTSVLNNDMGLGDTPVTVSLVTDVTNGTLTLNGDGTFSYTHDDSENFTDSFTYRVTDNDGETADATVVINVTPVSDATPVANVDGISVAEGGTATTLVGGASTVLNNDTGLSDTPVAVSLVTDVTNGSLTLNSDGTFSYTHDGSQNFTDSFTYRITDNNGETADATVMINVTPVSDATPVANADNITVAEGGTATTLVGGSGTVLNNDTGLDDTPVTVSLVTDVTNGTLTLNGDGTFSYTHDGSENFSDSFTYRITDNDGETADATVTINITSVSDATPVANADSITVAEGGTTALLDGSFTTVLNNDTGLGDTPVTVSLVTDVTNGTLTLNSDGTFNYTHDGSENFSDSFTYRVTDNDGETADATVAINVTPVSDATPIANADSITVAEGGTATTLVGGSGTVLNNDTGLGDTPVTVSLVTDVTNGTLSLNGDGTFSYTHDGSENFSDSFTYRVTDNDGEMADATVTINVISNNRAPVASSLAITVLEDGIYTGNLPTAVDNDGDTVIYLLDNLPAHGSVSVETDGRFSYTPHADYHGVDSFSYSVSDGNGGSNIYLVQIAVLSVNDAPIITSHSGSENFFITLEENSIDVTTLIANDPDNDRIMFEIEAGTDLGLFVIDPSSGELRFTNTPDMENPNDDNQDHQYQVQVLVSDGHGGTDRQTFTIAITDVDEFDVGLLMDIEETPDVITLSNVPNDGVGITAWAEDLDYSDNQITYTLDDDSNGLFTINSSSGVVTLTSAVENQDVSQFEITVRATSEDGSYTLKSFVISLERIIDLPVEPEGPYIDDVILDLISEDPVETPAETDESESSLGEPSEIDQEAVGQDSGNQEITQPLDTEENINKFDQPSSEYFSSLLMSDDKSNDSRMKVYHADLTPLPVTHNELPTFDTGSGDLIEIPDTIWHLLDSMNSEMSKHQEQLSTNDGLLLQSATFGTLALSAGYVAWLLRAGVLSASLLSSIPLWRQIDPLPVLSAKANSRVNKQDNSPEKDPDDQRIAKLFDRIKKPNYRRSGFFRKNA